MLCGWSGLCKSLSKIESKHNNQSPQNNYLMKMTRKIETSIEINAPIETVWKILINIGDWEWNRWTRLEAKEAKEGTSGKLKASFEGDNKWKTFDFVFGKVDASTHLLSWQGAVAGGFLFSGKHHIRLERVSDVVTRVEHNESFGGLLPALNLGLPYAKLERNYRLINEALKHRAEEEGH